MIWGETRKVALMLLSHGDSVYEIIKGKDGDEWLIRREVANIDHSTNELCLKVIGSFDTSFWSCKIDDLYYDINKHSYYVYSERLGSKRFI